MSDLFHDVASIDYPIIDADAHVNEPPDLWQARVPARLKHKAPKVLHTAEGDVWSFNEGEKLRPLGYQTIWYKHWSADTKFAYLERPGDPTLIEFLQMPGGPGSIA